MEIEVYHDVVCPWCRIGKKHLADGLARWDGPPPTVAWRPFFLDPTIPPDGRAFRQHMQASKGLSDLEPMFAPVRRAGAAAGVTFNLEAIDRAPNTLAAHRLLALAPPEDRAALLDTLYRLYFEQGRDLGDLGVLGAAAAEHGLDGATMQALLRGDAARDEVLAEAETARRRGVSGVPLFVFDGRFAVSGAQPPDVLLRALDLAAREPTVPAR